MKTFSFPPPISGISDRHLLLREDSHVHAARPLDQPVDGIAPKARPDAGTLAVPYEQLRNPPRLGKIKNRGNRILTLQNLNASSRGANSLQPLIECSSI
jgi:hypothetical protein